MRVTSFLWPILAAGLVAPGAAGAQNAVVGQAAGTGRITGSVSDREGRPLASVAITLRSAADSNVVSGALTERDGRFRLEGLSYGEYLLRVSRIGYRPRNSEVIRLTPEAVAVDLGEIDLELMPVELTGVEATVERSAVVVEADRTVYHTKSMLVAAAGTAIDVLRAVPELEVDVNDNVKLRGNQSVALHLNGRPAPIRGEQLVNFLKQLPGNRIARVEVMPNPSAKHDPEGMGGIVNIVLDDDLDLGLSGSLSVNASTRGRQNVYGRLNYQKGRLTLFSGVGVNAYEDTGTTYDLRQNLITSPVTLVEQTGRSTNEAFGWNGDWTAELKVGRQATLWSNAWLYGNGSDASGLTEYGILDEAHAVRDRYDRDNRSDFHYGSYNVGLGFKQVFEAQKRELTMDGRVSRGVNDTESRFTSLFHMLAGQPVELPLELTLNEIESGSGDLSIQADYFRPMAAGKLEVGYRAWQRDQDNDNVLRVFANPDAADPRERNRSGYDYEETFHSLYSTWGRTIGRFGMQAGLRAELSRTDFASRVGGASFDRAYNTLFPSLNLSYSPVPGRTLRFLYSRRISRPSAYLLDPYVPATDKLNVSVGNPDLEPTYSQSFSLDFSWTGRKGTVRLAPYYRSTSDMWERIRTVDTLGIATNRWENGVSAKAYGSNFTISLPPTGPLSGSTNVGIYRDVRDGTNISSEYRRSSWMWSLSGNLGLKVRPSLTAQLYAHHFPTQSILQGRASGYTYTSLALRQQVLGTKGSVSLSINDPLNLFRYTSSTRDATYVQDSRSSFVSRVAMLGFTFNFGKPPQQQSRRSSTEQAGETIRVR
jgi:outer membrane receptor protein involved in Fe transport